jgi:hypothetical protein
MPMPRARLGRAPLAVLLSGLLAACGSTTDPSSSELEPAGSGPITASSSATPSATATPSPTPEPSLSYTNPPDPDLLALIPDAAGGAPIAKPAVADYGLTPGDIGEVFGEIGRHFRSLAIAYIEQPRLSFYAMRMDGPIATTADLQPHLAEIGRYVGIAGLDPDPWSLAVVADREVWVRPEDNATAAGTMIYTWIADDVAFLIIGTDDSVNQALIAELPGVPAATPTPEPSGVPSGSAPASPAG